MLLGESKTGGGRLDTNEWIMCGRKKSFNTKGHACKYIKRVRDRITLRAYECPICYCWHVTKKTINIKYCECGELIDPFAPIEGQCPICMGKVAAVFTDIFSLVKTIRNYKNQQRQNNKDACCKNLEKLSHYINSAVIYLMRKQ